MLIPGLIVEGGYEAYKYEKNKPQSSPGISDKNQSSSTARKKIKHKSSRPRRHPSADGAGRDVGLEGRHLRLPFAAEGEHQHLLVDRIVLGEAAPLSAAHLRHLLVGMLG